tara:strand:- start:111 stop:392 length:282 start_codon:yes stop_codon:yes gene_type:complete
MKTFSAQPMTTATGLKTIFAKSFRTGVLAFAPAKFAPIPSLTHAPELIAVVTASAKQEKTAWLRAAVPTAIPERRALPAMQVMYNHKSTILFV